MPPTETETPTTRSTSSPAAETHGETQWQNPNAARTSEVKNAGAELANTTRQLADEVKQRGATLWQNQRRAAADEVSQMVQALRQTAHELGTDERSTTAQLAERAANSLDYVATTLRDRDLGELVAPVRDYARRHPGLFFGGSVALGLVLTQMLKGSGSSSGSPPSSYSH